jgi:hypothetical protein
MQYKNIKYALWRLAIESKKECNSTLLQFSNEPIEGSTEKVNRIIFRLKLCIFKEY